jgi:hypothetical protein
MRLYGLQTGVADRNAGRFLTASVSPLPSGPLAGACSPSLLGCNRLSPESCRNTFGDFQLIESAAQSFPFGIESREPLGNPVLLLFHQRSHLVGEILDDTPDLPTQSFGGHRGIKTFPSGLCAPAQGRSGGGGNSARSAAGGLGSVSVRNSLGTTVAGRRVTLRPARWEAITSMQDRHIGCCRFGHPSGCSGCHMSGWRSRRHRNRKLYS